MDLDILVPIAGMATGVLLLFPIVRSVVRITEKKLTGGAESDQLAAFREELGAMHERLERFEYVDDRIVELEERVDFTERLLAQQEREQIKGEHGS